MLPIYIACLIFGGAFVALSVVSGLGDGDLDADKEFELDKELEFDKDFEFELDADADVDADLDADGDGDAEFEKDIEVSPRRRFMPLFSFKFYTFSLAFFGLTGTLLTMLGALESQLGIALTSAVMGLAAGLSMTYLLHLANRSVGGRGVTTGDYVGASAKVLMPIQGGHPGKVRVVVRGRKVDLLAVSDDAELVFDFDDEVFVLGVEDGVARVVHPGQIQRRDS